MKLLLLEWSAYTQRDVNEILGENHVQFKSVSYCFKDKNKDDFFLHRFEKYLSHDQYDAVFTVNYFPLVAIACQNKGIPYISWSYDNPLNVPEIEKTLGLECNYVFLFDKIQVKQYRDKGFNNVHHLPLAVNTKRLKRISLSSYDWKKYKGDISFVGKLYPSAFLDLLNPLNEYMTGYLKAFVDAQFKVYGYYFLDELLTEPLMNKLNSQYEQQLGKGKFHISKEQISYAAASFLTRQERVLLLGILSKYYQVNLYSREEHPALSKVNYRGSAKYLEEMPKIFMASKINLNITLKILQTGIPLRALDILGAGGFLLSNYQEELAQYFVPEEEFSCYTSIEEAVVKAEYYLKNEEERKKIAQGGLKKASTEFSYEKRFQEMFRIVGI